MRVLFVCTGNTCRSPMAEAILKEIAEERNLEIEVQSAGVYAADGQIASRNAIKAVDTKEIKEHRSQRLTKELMKWADLVLVMTGSHLDIINELYPEAKHKTHLFLDYTEYKEQDIADPFGGSIEEYELVKRQLEEAVFGLLEKINEEEI